MNEKFMNGLLSFAGKMQSNKVLSAIKDAFVVLQLRATRFPWLTFPDSAGSLVFGICGAT